VLLTVPVGVALLGGCATTGGGGARNQVAGVPQDCTEFHSQRAEELHRVLLIDFDKLEMAGHQHPELGKRVLEHLLTLLRACPRLVMPHMLRQLELPVHERQRAPLATLLGLFPPGKDASLPVLARLLDDEYPTVRYSAAGSILDLAPNAHEDRAARILVEQALDDWRPGIRAIALQALSAYAGETFEDPAAAQRWLATRQ
jgi:hypothetical protein